MPRLRFLRPSTGLGLEKRGIHPPIWSFIGRFHYLHLFAWFLLALISASLDFMNDELEVVPVQPGLDQNVVKDFHSRFRRPVHLNDGVPFVHRQGNLVLNALDAAAEVVLQLVIGFLQDLLPVLVSRPFFEPSLEVFSVFAMLFMHR